MISEEYGFRSWYAVLSDESWDRIQQDWKTIKGLNCLVPVPFLIPEAHSFPILPEHQRFVNEDVEVVSAHIHQHDDSGIEGVEHKIPEGDFEFKGVAYTEGQVRDIFEEYQAKYQETHKFRRENEPGYFDNNFVFKKNL